MYTKDEKIEMITLYQSENSLRMVRDLFAVKYPERPIPCISTIQKVVEKFKSEGCILNIHKRKARNNTVLTDDMKLNIICYFEDTPMATSFDAAKFFGISRTSVYKTLKEYRYKTYKAINYQHILCDEDIEKRTVFCEFMFSILNKNEKILKNIIFSDEATFTLNGEVNSGDFRYWRRANTHVTYDKKVNVWLGINKRKLIGPFFFEGNLTSCKYLDLLRKNIVPSIEKLSIREPWFQMDDAPAHSTNTITEFLHQQFPGCWMGTYGPIPWPARSADLSPHKFFLWGYLKNKIYNNISINTVEELKERICVECAKINSNVLRNILQDFHDRLGYCLIEKGGQFEHLL